MAEISSLALYKRIKKNQRTVVYLLPEGYERYLAYALEIVRFYQLLELRANMLCQKSAKIQIKKLQKEMEGQK